MTPYTIERTIRLLGQSFTVETWPTIESAHGDTQVGRLNHNLHIIGVANDIHVDLQRETLLHEALHAMFYLAGFDEENNEDTINRIAPILLEALTENPWFTDYLLTGIGL